ncbi:MAG TPA: hypothetical protein VHB21_18955 [Minicystis sp.]|nr:hypothetical protein [Minicystis sp.]
MPTTRLRDARLRAFAIALAALAPAATASCHTPSEDVDAGDLLGVFSRDGGVDASDAAAPARSGRRAGRRGKDGGARASASASSGPVETSVRAPIQGACLAAEGTADRDLKKTIGRPACRDALVLEWKDALGSPRYACVFAPKGVDTRAPLPTVLFFHDGLDDPTMVDKKTSLRKLLGTADLTGDPAHRGFLVVAVQGRAVAGGRRGAAFDTAYTGADNVDVAAVDHFLGEVASKGWVDGRRVYALGPSTGGEMAELYAMMRPDKVAAFGVFAAEPLAAKWACGGPPPPAAVLYRACDRIVACDAVETWLHARDDGRAETAWARLGDGNDDEPNCAFKHKCGEVKGTANHRRWPKGKEGFFLKFFAKHALGGGGSAAPAAPAAAE